MWHPPLIVPADPAPAESRATAIAKADREHDHVHLWRRGREVIYGWRVCNDCPPVPVLARHVLDAITASA